MLFNDIKRCGTDPEQEGVEFPERKIISQRILCLFAQVGKLKIAYAVRQIDARLRDEILIDAGRSIFLDAVIRPEIYGFIQAPAFRVDTDFAQPVQAENGDQVILARSSSKPAS